MDKYPRYYLNQSNGFVIENYNLSKPFASFFAGIAGKYGIPMWVFYVNRGQAISSFGIRDKDSAILEFFPANKAWQLVSCYGFRTFLKLASPKKASLYEPFQDGLIDLKSIKNSLCISAHGLSLEEENLSLGLKIKVDYFNIPNESYAGLARVVTIKNVSRSKKAMQLIDGLPQIVPFGANNFFLKKMGRTIEAWMNVENLKKRVPFYKLDVDPADKPEVIHIKGGNFYLGFHYQQGVPKLLKPIVDPQAIFAMNANFSFPAEFSGLKNFTYPKHQTIRSKTPCGFLLLDLKLPPQQEKTFYSVIGFMKSKEALNASLARIIARGYLKQKEQENKRLIDELQQDITTQSSSREFNLYAKQTYLDNILRGGYPIILGNKESKSVFHLYSRKHGDLERDYNKFLLEPSYFSQGNGNYRDINQNRRCEVWFNPEVEDQNLIFFLSLLQADGFNPLVVKGISFILKDESGAIDALRNLAGKEKTPRIISFLKRPFTPGELILFIEENRVKLRVSGDEFLGLIIPYCEKITAAEHAEGFWTDHWTYNLDLIESYLGVYPEKLRELLFTRRVFTFYDNYEIVKPRCEKYLLKDGRVKQLHSLRPDNAKKEMLKNRAGQAHLVRADYGRGRIYNTSLLNKLLCLLANKLASLDPFGVGVEMEADKPNWFDALNGLPALLGSSCCETFELKRLALFLKNSLEQSKTPEVPVTEEIKDFLFALHKIGEDYFNSDSQDRDCQYWDKSHTLREQYCYKTRFGFNGREVGTAVDNLTAILNRVIEKLNTGLAKAQGKKEGLYYSYFINEAVKYEILNDTFVKPTEFIQKRLPLFLEGQMHALRLAEGPDRARPIYRGTKLSPLYDKKLKMYKVTAPLSKMPEEIGRCRVFSPGWLENESIWLHMEYKYLLELLKNGLYEEFYEDLKQVLIPFQKPQRYGRSILENSSFLVSSAFRDKDMHGRGFVARLSGSTAEFLNIWLLMNLGQKPFFLNSQGQLNLRFHPLLAGWLFDKKGGYAFNFLSKIRVTYHNPKRNNTFGKGSVSPKKIIFNDINGRGVEIAQDTIPSPFAQQIRARQINRIDIYLD